MVSLYDENGTLMVGGAGFLQHITSASQAVKYVLSAFQSRPGLMRTTFTCSTTRTRARCMLRTFISSLRSTGKPACSASSPALCMCMTSAASIPADFVPR